MEDYVSSFSARVENVLEILRKRQYERKIMQELFKRYSKAEDILSNNGDISKIAISGGCRAYLDSYSDWNENPLLEEMYEAEKMYLKICCDRLIAKAEDIVDAIEKELKSNSDDIVLNEIAKKYRKALLCICDKTRLDYNYLDEESRIYRYKSPRFDQSLYDKLVDAEQWFLLMMRAGYNAEASINSSISRPCEAAGP